MPIILVCAIIAAVSAAPQINHPQAAAAAGYASKDSVILRYDNNNIGVDGYNYAVETSDGQQKEEQGQLQDVGTDAEGIAVQGRYSYPGPDGVLYEVVYIADRDGFRAQGAHLPVASSAAH